MLINQAETAIPTENVSEQEILRVENEYWVTMARDLEKLKATPEFQRVILNGYFKDKAINGVSLLATEYVKQSGVRGDIMEQLVAISHLEDYFATIDNLGTVPTEDDEE